MKEFSFSSEIWLARSRSEVFPFFADARNLGAITPPWLSFRILTPAPIVMRPGLLIDYEIRLRGLPLRWRTKISEWESPTRFVDEQVTGPYRQWIHEHTFEESDGGTLCRDRVRYSVLGGRLINALFVRRDIERIFEFRRACLLKRFGSSDRATGEDILRPTDVASVS